MSDIPVRALSRREGSSRIGAQICAGVAQLVEQLICNQQVAGSTPVASSNSPRLYPYFIYSLKISWIPLPLGFGPTKPRGAGWRRAGFPGQKIFDSGPLFFSTMTWFQVKITG